ncbi:hypothetical protein L2E82_51174 [Cichorium intybus]|nr:hypothetical protein L2E82_51174 [Cichorium intybus]
MLPVPDPPPLLQTPGQQGDEEQNHELVLVGCEDKLVQPVEMMNNVLEVVLGVLSWNLLANNVEIYSLHVKQVTGKIAH